MKKLLITGCTDGHRWYSDKIGKLVSYLDDMGDEYKSKEDAGHINFVQYADAQIVNFDDENELISSEPKKKIRSKDSVDQQELYTLEAHSKRCIGCQRNDAYIMLSMQTEYMGEVTDVFLNKDLAEYFYDKLSKVLQSNKDKDETI